MRKQLESLHCLDKHSVVLEQRNPGGRKCTPGMLGSQQWNKGYEICAGLASEGPEIEKG